MSELSETAWLIGVAQYLHQMDAPGVSVKLNTVTNQTATFNVGIERENIGADPEDVPAALRSLASSMEQDGTDSADLTDEEFEAQLRELFGDIADRDLYDVTEYDNTMEGEFETETASGTITSAQLGPEDESETKVEPPQPDSTATGGPGR